MIRRTFWQGLLGCAAAALLAGCGSNNATIPIKTTPPANVQSQFITKSAGGAVTSGASTVTFPANALSQDAIVTVTDSPTTLPTADKTSGLLGSTIISASNGATLASGVPVTLSFATGHTDSTRYAVDLYRLDSGSPVEVDAVSFVGGTATLTVPAFGTYAAYDTSKGASPTFPLTTLTDGLAYIDTAVGTGATATATSNVTVHYIGALTSGQVFDSNTGTIYDASYAANNTLSTPFAVTLGSGQVITGFNEGIVGMKVGGRRRISIPSALGYGATGSPPSIPANSDLIFDVQLLSVN